MSDNGDTEPGVVAATVRAAGAEDLVVSLPAPAGVDELPQAARAKARATAANERAPTGQRRSTSSEPRRRSGAASVLLIEQSRRPAGATRAASLVQRGPSLRSE